MIRITWTSKSFESTHIMYYGCV